MTIQAENVILLKIHDLNFQTKFQIYGWLKASVKISTVSEIFEFKVFNNYRPL